MVQRNKTACVHYVVPKQQTRHLTARCHRNRQLNNNTTPAAKRRSEHVVTTDFPPPAPPAGCGHRVTAVIAWGKRPVPSRTRKLRPTAPMVLHPGGCGRVGHRRNTINGRGPPPPGGGPPAFNPLLRQGRDPGPGARAHGQLPPNRAGTRPDAPGPGR